MSPVDNAPPPPPPTPQSVPGTPSTAEHGPGQPQTPPRETGPQRFQRADETRPARGSLPKAVAAGAALAVLIIGVPVGLIALAGAPPVPTSWPTREDLTSTIGVEQLVGVLLWIVWLAWLQFTACVFVELRSALRGFGLPAPVPMSGAAQRLARVLVGSVLLAATAVGQASAAVPATVAEASAATAGKAVASVASTSDGTVAGTVEESPGAHDQSERAGSAPSDQAVYRLGDVVLDPSEGKKLLGHKVYIVQPPEGRYHDNLWDIAERALGDGRRYHEIFELNKGRTQFDGHQLSLARLIYPNWLLVMPDDASGVATVTFDEPAADEESPAQEHSGELSGEAGGDAEAGGDQTSETGGEQAGGEEAGGKELSGGSRQGTGEPAEDAAGPVSYGDLIRAGLMAAGIMAAIEVVRRRRRTPEPADDELEAEVALRIGADSDRMRWLDYALRSLAATCQHGDRPLPAVYAASVDNASVELMLAPAVSDAPEPWEVSEEGRKWTLRRELVVGADQAGAAEVVAPYPGLVSLGRDGERDVLLDLEAAGGPVSVVGDPGAAFEVVTAIAVELATNHWSDQLRVTATGLPDELTVFEQQRLRLEEDVADVLPELSARRVQGMGPDVLTGRLRPGGGGAWMPEYVVLGDTPGAETAAQLVELTGASSRSPLGVVCAGEVPGARWRLSVDSTGTLDVPVLGLRVRANQLSWRSIEAISGLLEPERTGGDDPGGPVLHEAWLPEARPDVPEPPDGLDVAHLATAPVRVFVLGPVEVQAPNTLDDERLALATEIVVHLALHPEGVHPTVLAAAVWPQGVTAEVREATFARVREWLGTDPDGSPHLLMTTDGKLKLSSDVVLDWDVVCALLRRSRAVGTAKEEIDLLRQALRVARGPVLAERPQGRYAWIARVRLERLAADVLVDAAHRLSVLCGDGGDPGTAAAAARAGLRVRPGEQLLWRDLLRAQQSLDGAAGAAGAADDMSATLAAIGVTDIEPETGALLDELLPGSAGQRPGSHRRDSA